MICFPNAKINIGLNILRKRSDNYHDIETVMVPVDWSDILEAVPLESPTDRKHELHLKGLPINCPPEKNLIVKALNKIECHVNRKFEINIFLRKTIPHGAGLGGGSADAAFMIKLLNDEYRLGLDVPEMERLAGELGSDCPFFIRNIPVSATGRGDRTQPVNIPLNNWKALIVKPSVSVSTAEAYCGVIPSIPEEPLINLITLPVDQWKNKIKNDFENTVFKLFPDLRQIKEELYCHGAIYASMSGSGSAFYGLFPPDSDNLSETVRFFKAKNMTVKLAAVKI